MSGSAVLLSSELAVVLSPPELDAVVSAGVDPGAPEMVVLISVEKPLSFASGSAVLLSSELAVVLSPPELEEVVSSAADPNVWEMVVLISVEKLLSFAKMS